MEWKTVKLGEVAIFRTGKLDSNAAVIGGKYPFFTCSPLTLAINDYAFDQEAILLAGNNAEGNFNIKYYKGRFNAYQRTYVINPKMDNLDIKYLYYALKICLGKLKTMSQGTSTKFLTVKLLNNFNIPLPSLDTQHRIAAIFSSLDDKIENNNCINANLEAQAHALFKSWFMDFEPWGGVMPKDWIEGDLGEICTPLKEKVGSRNDVKVLSPVTTGKLMLSEEYFSKQVFSQSVAKYIIVPPTAFAYNPARVNIGSLGMNEFDFDGCVSPVYVVFECKEGYEYFFDLYRRTDQFKEEVKSRAIGGVRQTLGYDDFECIQATIPPKEIIVEFNKIYIAMLNVLNANKRENQRLAALRDTLLSKLMRGEIAV